MRARLEGKLWEPVDFASGAGPEPLLVMDWRSVGIAGESRVEGETGRQQRREEKISVIKDK